MAERADIQELAVAAAAGDPDAFRKLVPASQGLAWALAVRMLGDEEEARDVVQEAFIRVWRHLPRFRPETRFTTWFYRIVSNLALDRLRARRRRSRILVSAPEKVLLGIADPSGGTGPGEEPLSDRLSGLIGLLPPVQRLVYVLRDLHELTVREVTRVTGLPEHSVKTNLFHARRRLRQELEAAGRG
jgi:RNA polymerase sigma-70 factor (ECF subfamily)